MATHDAPGWYGKLAVLGDFASRRLASEWVQGWDHWLSAGLQASQHQLGTQWLDTYLAAPVWRFGWAPGVAGAPWWFGVLMPSCDNVGRYFPLVVLQSRAQPPADRFGFDHLELWWRHLAGAALQTLEVGATLAAFEAALHDAPPWPGAPASAALRPMLDASYERFAVSPGATLDAMVHALAADALKRQWAGHSFWWPVPAGGVGGHCTMVPGLPPQTAFADLLRGDW
jgi:type VI secretion system protein ImpM